MPTYYRYTIQGRHTAASAHAALGPAASHGVVVRIDTQANQTHVTIAADTPPGPQHKPPAGVQAAVIVPESEVLRIS